MPRAAPSRSTNFIRSALGFVHDRRSFAKINDRASQDTARFIDAQPAAAVAVKKAQAKLPLMIVDPAFAHSCNDALPHEFGDVSRVDMKKITQR